MSAFTYSLEGSVTSTESSDTFMITLESGDVVWGDTHSLVRYSATAGTFTSLIASDADLPWTNASHGSYYGGVPMIAHADAVYNDTTIITKGDFLLVAGTAALYGGGWSDRKSAIFRIPKAKIEGYSSISAEDWTTFNFGTGLVDDEANHYAPGTDIWPRRTNPSIFVHSSGTVILFGGADSNSGSPISPFDIWTSTNWVEWTRRADTTLLLSFVTGSVAVYNDSAYCYGARVDGYIRNKLYRFDWNNDSAILSYTDLGSLIYTSGGSTSVGYTQTILPLSTGRFFLFGSSMGTPHEIEGFMEYLTKQTNAPTILDQTSDATETGTVLNDTQLFISKTVYDEPGVTDATTTSFYVTTYIPTGEGGGDPYITPLYHDITVKLPVVRASFRLFEQGALVVNASLKVMTHTAAYASVNPATARRFIEHVMKQKMCVSTLDDLSFFDKYFIGDRLTGEHVVVDADTLHISGDASNITATDITSSTELIGRITKATKTFVQSRVITHTPTNISFKLSAYRRSPLLRSSIRVKDASVISRKDALGLLIDPTKFPPFNQMGEVDTFDRFATVPLRGRVHSTTGSGADTYITIDSA